MDIADDPRERCGVGVFRARCSRTPDIVYFVKCRNSEIVHQIRVDPCL